MEASVMEGAEERKSAHILEGGIVDGSIYDRRHPRCAKTGDVARMFGVTPRYIRELAKRGYFGDAAFKLGDQYRYNMPKIMERFHLTPEEVSE
jgi:hypothetical protein